MSLIYYDTLTRTWGSADALVVIDTAQRELQRRITDLTKDPDLQEFSIVGLIQSLPLRERVLVINEYGHGVASILRKWAYKPGM